METYKTKVKRKLDMVWEAKRLETFKSWPFAEDKSCSASKMAEAGFYFTGSAEHCDAVQCFLCGKSLDGWEDTDDPWSEHLKHADYCKFAQLRQPEAALSFKQWISFKTEVLHNEFKESMQEMQDDLDKEGKSRMIKVMKFISSLRKKNR